MFAEPTNEMPSISGWSSSASTTSRPPLTMLSAPAGKMPSSWMISKTASWASGTCSLGLTIRQLPVASANGMNQNGTIIGKLNGQIAANTPIGWR